jgi:hypothetical protein
VVEALHFRADTAKAVKADASLAGVDGLTEFGGAHEIEFLEVAAGRRRNSGECLDFASPTESGQAPAAGNFLREPHVHHVARFAAVDQTQRAVLHEPAQGRAHGFFRKAKIARQPNDGEMKSGLSFQTAVTEKVIINGAVGGGEAQARGESVLELLADEFGVGLLGFHEEIGRPASG